MQEKDEAHQSEEQSQTEDSEDIEFFEIPPDDELQEDLELEKLKAGELLERLQRLQADYENYRKRMDSRLQEAIKFASESILLKVLEVYDNIERALEMDFKKDPESTRQGIDSIHQQISKILNQEDVRPIQSLGQQFDPYYQHAVGTENDSKKPDGLVVAELQKGYMIREKVLRPALVVVNRNETSPAFEEEDLKEDNQESSDKKGE